MQSSISSVLFRELESMFPARRLQPNAYHCHAVPQGTSSRGGSSHFLGSTLERPLHQGAFSFSNHPPSIACSMPKRDEVAPFPDSNRLSLTDGNKDSTMSTSHYYCAFCPKSFSYRSHLDRHLRTHTNERPYPCPKCCHKAKHKNDLLRHLTSIHATTILETDQTVGTMP